MSEGIFERRRAREFAFRFADELKRAKEGDRPKLRESGLLMSDEQSAEFDRLCAQVFAHPRGDELLDLLELMTIGQTNGPGVDPSALLHLEGQRYHQSVLSNAVLRGRRAPPQPAKEPKR
jgi:hypothetical protein